MKGTRKWIGFFLGFVCLFFNGCSSQEEPFHEIEPGSVYQGPIEIHEPKATNAQVLSGGQILVDVSNVADGYLMIKTLSGFDTRLKCRISHEADQYTYDLPSDGEYVVFPLQMGDGEYTISVYQNTEGTSYAQIFSESFAVALEEDNRVFVFPNQLVWYTREYPAVLLSYDICQSLSSDQEKVDAIYRYIENYMTYDTDKAARVQSGYIPDLTRVLEEKKGICFDYAALMAAMLRAQDIPSRLVMGNLTSEGIYHAWNEVYVDGQWRWYDPTYGSANSNEQSDYVDDRRY